MKFARTVILAGLVLASSARSFADTIVWSGLGSDNKWTTPENWVGGNAPSVDDTAQFGVVDAGARTTVDLQDVGAIGGIVIVGDEAPTYTFGASDSDGQCACFAAAGTGVSVQEGVVNMPVFRRIRVVQANSTAVTLTICNDSAGILDIPMVRPTLRATGVSGAVATTFDLRGSGDIRFKGVFPDIDGSTTSDYIALLNQTGKLRIGTVYGPSPSSRPPYTFKTGSVADVSCIEVEESCALVTRTQYGKYFEVVDSDLEVTGEGTFGVAWHGTYSQSENRLKIAAGRRLTVKCTYGGVDGVRKHHDLKPGGALVFDGANTLTGPVQSFFGVMETSQPGGFGAGGMWLDGGGVLRYAGNTDWTTSQSVCLTNWPAAKTMTGTLETAGDGLWTIAGDISVCHNSGNNPVSAASGTLTLSGVGNGSISGVVKDGDSGKSLALAKSGTGTWTLTGANTFTGLTTLNEGTLKVEATSTLANSSGIVVQGGALAFEGGTDATTAQTIAGITISDNGTLELEGNVVVTVASVSASAGKSLNVVTESPDAKLIVPAGTSSSAFKWNGLQSVIGDDGVVKADVDAVIAARGGIVPNNNGTVAIAYKGSIGNDTLAADETILAKLMQQSRTAATIEIGTGRSLSVPVVALGVCAADLALGTELDEGSLDSTTKTITYDNASADGRIVVNAAIASGVTNAIENGTVAICGDNTLGRTTIAMADAAKAKLEVRGCTVETGKNPIIIGHNAGNDYNGGGMQYGEVTVSNALVYNAEDIARASHTYSATAQYAFLVGKNASGILRIQDGAVVSNKLQIGTSISGTAGRGSGAVYQSGGKVVTIGDAGYQANCMGNAGSMGYYELKGGEFFGNMAIATYGYGIWHQEPGTTADLRTLNIARANGGRADVYIRGRTSASGSNGNFCGGYQSGNASVTTIDGEGAILDCGYTYMAAFRSDSDGVCTARVNVVRGGKFKAGLIYSVAKSAVPSRLALSFDGGTFVCGQSQVADIFAYTAKPVDDVRIYKGGMTVETESGNANAGTAVPLLKPEGKGVSEIPFDFDEFAEWNCPPYITINGDGDGATAHALFDSASQSVTGVVVTCSGTGYTWAKAVASYRGNSCPSSKTVDCVLADNDQTGSFTKAGSGTFTLNAENGWGGETIAAGGTLKVGCNNAIPENASIVLNGGDIDFNGKVCSVGRVTYGVGGGQLRNTANVQLPSTFDVAITAEDILAGKSVVLTESQSLDGSALTVTGDLSALDPDVCRSYTVVSHASGQVTGAPVVIAPKLPIGWQFETSAAGVVLRYSSNLGLTIIFK